MNHRHTFFRHLILITTLLVSPNLRADGISKYPTVQKMMEEEATDYLVEDGTFKVISNHPLHIQISPLIPVGSPSDFIERTVHQEAVYTVFQVFIHTPVNELTITVLPKSSVLVKNLDGDENHPRVTSKTGAPLTEFRVSLTVTRKRALALLNRYFPGKRFEDLVGTQDGGPNALTQVFDVLISHVRPPGVKAVFVELAQRGE